MRNFQLIFKLLKFCFKNFGKVQKFYEFCKRKCKKILKKSKHTKKQLTNTFDTIEKKLPAYSPENYYFLPIF